MAFTPGPWRDRWRRGRKAASYDSLDEIRLGGLGCIERRRDAAVAQDRRLVGDLHHFVDVVGHEDHAGPAGDHGADQSEQLVDVPPWQEGRRLVEHQQAVAGAALLAHLAHRPDDGQQGALHRREIGNPGRGVERDAVLLEAAHRQATLRSPVDGPVLRLGQASEQQVLKYREARDEPQMLVDEAHAIVTEGPWGER